MTPLTGIPLNLLRTWLPANDDPDRPQIILATVRDGAPDARTVLMSEWDAEGFFFHTDARSRKVTDIRSEPRVAIVVLWPGFTKQLTVQGVAEIAPAEEQIAAYERRSPYLKTLAWLNDDDLAQLPRSERVARWQQFLEQRDVTELEPPATWIGFRVRPTRLTFWQSDPETASRRVEFRETSDGWHEQLLAG
jgi:pyridoxamine 5'-phosphate oxidase